MSKYLKLLALVVKSRISRPMLIIVLLVLAYGIFSGVSLYTSGVRLTPQALRSEEATAVVYATILTFLSSFQGGVAVLKSDRDYLFTLPLGKAELASALFIGQLLLSGALTVVWLGWILPLLELPPLLAVLGGVLYAIYLTSLSASIAELDLKRRVPVVALLTVWTISPILGNPVAPSSMFYGRLGIGLAVLGVLTVALTAEVALRLSRAPLVYGYASQASPRVGSGLVGRPLSFAGASPVGAIYRLKLMAIPMAGRVAGFGGGSRYYTGRVRVEVLLSAVSAAAAVYVAVMAFLIGRGYVTPGLLGPGSGTTFIALYLPLIIVEALAVGFAASWPSTERPWLAFTSMRPGRYMRHVALAWVIVSLVIAAPFAVAMYVVSLLGLGRALNAVPLLLLGVPSVSLLSLYMSSAFVINPQVRHEGVMPGQARARGLVLSLIIMVLVGLTAFAMVVSLRTTLISSALLALVLLLPLALSDGLWDAAARRMVEGGYV